MCILFHKWAEWEQYKHSYTKTLTDPRWTRDIRGKTFEIEEERQCRVCRACGYKQDEKVKKL